MSNWMAGISRAASGLDAARYGLSVVSQNMANATTPGYTRQSAELSAADTSGVSGIVSGHGTMDGVVVSGTTRAADLVLDARVRNEDAKGALADTNASSMTDVENVLGEPSDTGLSSQLDTFWNDWGRVATQPSSTAVRTVLLRDAGTVAATLNAKAASLSGLVDSTAQAMAADVADVNTAATRLADLNGQIAVGSATGANVNSLLDERDTLLDALSTTAGASVTIDASGTASVVVGGQTLVSGTTSASMTVDASSHAIAVGGTTVTVGSGSLAARQTTLATTLPAVRSALDSVATKLAAVVNSAQRSGFDSNGNAGTDIFSGTGAGDLTVVLTDPARVAASAVAGGGLDNSVAVTLSKSAAGSASPDALFAALVGDVASTSSAATQRAATQSAVRASVDNLKTSLRGVSLDEEAASMLTYQQSFNANSRVLTAIDSMLDTLINHTGLVGRS